jgi:hypothetical protein
MKIELTSYTNDDKGNTFNNKLTIEDDTSKIIHEKKNTTLTSSENYSITMTPQEQFKNYPNYHFFEKFGILFCKIGNTITCNFDPDNYNAPKICIGPHWYLAVISNILITVFIFTMYYCLIDSDVNVGSKFVYFLIGFLIYFFFNRCALINPGIVQKKNIDINNMEYCNICQVYYNEDKKVQHCKMCNICVEKMDHHCVWVGKCVGKNNIFSFYAMLASIGLIYLFIIYLAFFQFSTKTKSKK